ncbi:MAG: adenosine deaminase [Gemmatimonadota bacterium]
MTPLAGDERPDDHVRRRLRRLPKAELHVHLDGSLRPDTLLDLARASGVTLPTDDSRGLARFMRAGTGESLVRYLALFEITLSVMQSAEALERIAYELGEDLTKEGVIYAEIRYSPVLHTRRSLFLEEAVEAPLRGVRRAEREFGIRLNLIICAIRNMDTRTSEQLAELAVAYRGRGVVGFDLAGAEADNPPKAHAAAFAVARAGNLGVTVHAGEAFGAASIRQALHICGAHRIGHGTRLYEDPELLDYVRDFRVPLEICLTSNVQTGAAKGVDDHPLRLYFNAGLVLSLNTDNRLISGTTVIAEYWKARQRLGFSWAELCSLAVMSFEGAFLPWPEKLELVRRARRDIEGDTEDQPVT